MKTANVATAKNQLSRLLRRVKRGETVVITERSQPVAQLQPFKGEGPADGRFERLYDAGLLTPPAAGALDVAGFVAARRPRLAGDRSLTAAVLQEREESP